MFTTVFGSSLSTTDSSGLGLAEICSDHSGPALILSLCRLGYAIPLGLEKPIQTQLAVQMLRGWSGQAGKSHTSLGKSLSILTFKRSVCISLGDSLEESL